MHVWSRACDRQRLPIDQHHETFKGTGLLKNFQLQLHIDPSVTQIQQPIRRVPYHTRQKVEQELERLQSLDIIEPVSGPTSWLNPFIPVPKSDGNIRLCLDMRQANQAIKRERHVIPKMEDIIQDLHGAKVFSKIDLREGYHQIKLHENSYHHIRNPQGTLSLQTIDLWSKLSFREFPEANRTSPC